MKKAFLYMIAALVLLTSLCVVPAMAAEEAENVHADHCICGGTLTDEVKTVSGHTCEDITWEAWGDDEAEKDALPKEGSYYLVADLTLSSESATGPCDVKENTVLNLCLNGHSITTKGRTFDLYGILNLSDCQGTGVVTGNVENKTTGVGGVVIIRNKATAALNLYGGILQQAEAYTNTTGGVIYIQDGKESSYGTVNMYGGTVSGGKASGGGGNVYISKYSVFNMYGGTVTGGQTTGNGGNVYLNNYAVCNMFGGTVTGGNAGNRGGNFAVLDYATLNMSGGLVTGGQAATQGGNIRGMGNSIVKISGGTVSDGVATTDGGNIYFAGATLELTGGIITGGQAVNGGNLYRGIAAVTLGAVTISNGAATENGGNIYTPEGINLTLKGTVVSGGSAVNGGSIRAGGTFLMTSGSISGGVATGNGGNIYGLRSVKIHGGTVEKGSAVLGGNIYTMRYATTTGTNWVYVEAYGGNILNGTASESGGNIYTDGQFTMQAGQLSGGTATEVGGNLYMLKCGDELAVCSISGGEISGGQAVQGGNMYLMGAKANMTGGTVSGGVATNNGGNIAVAGSTVATLNGITVSGGSANGGGNLFLGVATVTVEGETLIENGWSNKRGGNIRVDNAKSVLNINGGQILNGGKNAEGETTSTYGGNIDVFSGKVNMSAGTVSGGAAKEYGGNIAVENNSVLTVTGGTLTGGTAPSGGNIAVLTPNTTSSISDADISGGVAQVNGGNILVMNDAVLNLTGGKVSGGSANGGANILVENGTLNLDGTTVENGTAKARGGNIRINASGIGSIKNATISGGSATYGGNLCVFLSGQAAVENTIITGGTATTNGGSISVERTASLIMTNCTVNGGDVPTTSDEMGFGGSIFVDNTASLAISGGTITGGASRFGGALAVCSTGSVTVNGAAITSGTGNNGTAIYVAPGCGLTMTDTTVTGSGTGTTIWNRGIITLAGTFDMPKMEFDLMIDCRFGESYLDLKDLTAIGEDPISLRRWAIDSIDDDCGLLAINATEEQLAMFEARKYENYKIVHENGTLVLNSAYNVQSLDASGKLLGGYETLTDALTDEGVKYVLYASLDGQQIGKDILLDLNGNSLANVTISADATVQLMDSATDDYAGEYGLLSGTVDGTVVAPEAGKSYLVVCADGAWSAHCYTVELTHVSLKPSDDALGYKAQIKGDEIVLAHVKSFGFNLSVAGGASKSYTKDVEGEFDGIFTLRLQGIMAANGGQMDITGSAFVIFDTEDKSVTSGENTTSMKQTILAVNGIWESLNDAQKTSVKGLYDAYADTMDAWFDENTTNNIKAWAPATEA